MYYKVLFHDRVIDVLTRLSFVKYQEKNQVMLACAQSEAQAIVSSDGANVWHVAGLYRMPLRGIDTVELVEIDRYEYEQLRALNLKTPEEIIDEYTLSLIAGGVL